MDENAPNFNVAQGTVKFEADQSAIDAAFQSIEQRLGSLGEKMKAAFDLSDTLRDTEDRLDRIEQRAASVKIPTTPEPPPPQPLPERAEGQPPPIPFDVDKETTAAKAEETNAKVLTVLEEIHALMVQLVQVQGEN